jgi:WD40 repeat protein
MANETWVFGLKKWASATLISALLFLLPAAPAKSQFYNGSQLSFGKSRVQYNDFLWLHFRFEKFDTYFYLNGKELAQYASAYADKHIKEIELDLQANLEEKIQFIIFNNLTDLKQSNIGLYGDWEYYNTGGVTRIIGGRVLLFFDGDYSHFEQQIRAGIAQVILNNMIYGTGIGAQIKNNALFTMPEWYMNGLISYVSRPWDADLENQVRDAMLSNQYEKFNSLSGLQATAAGHSLWHFVALKYGRSAIPNIVYMARLSRNVEKGFLYAIGVSFGTIVQDWKAFYRDLYSAQIMGTENPSGTVINKKNRPERVFGQLKISPDGERIAYTTHELGIYKVFLTNAETGKKKRIYRGGYRLADRSDYTYPLIAWHPNGKGLAMMIERKGEAFLGIYNIGEKHWEWQILYNFDKVLDMAYSDDGTRLVFSAVQKGQSDLFIFNIASGSHEQLTKDIYNDLNPRFIDGSTRIVFSSNRPGDTIRFDEKVKADSIRYVNDLFIYNYSGNKAVLQRLTKTPDAHETQPYPYGDHFFCFLSDRSGIINRYLARYDSAIAYIDTTTHYRYFTTTFPITNYSRNILEQDVSVKAAKIGEVVFMNRNFRLFTADLIRPGYVEKTEPRKSFFKGFDQKQKEAAKTKAKSDSLLQPPEAYRQSARKHFSTVRLSEVAAFYDVQRDSTGNPTGMAPGSPVSGDSTGKRLSDITAFLKNRDVFGKSLGGDTTNKFANPKQLNYNVEYYIDQMVTQIDFTYLNWAYQPFTGGSVPDFINPGLNALFMVGITDLMEDYRISGGIRLNFNLINNEYLFSYSNFRRRLNHQITFHRTSVEEYAVYSLIRHRVHELYYIATYPFNPVLNIRGTAAVRYDRAVFLATDQYNLRIPDEDKVWASLKAELTYDNTRNIGLNLYHGTRWKLFGEYYQMVNTSGNNMVVVGFDIRNYQKVHRTLIWANRVAGSTSFGSNKLIYYMGGVDNWLFPKFTVDTPIDRDANYAFQTLATNMRGFAQNIRNGNSFMVFNSELRWPVFRYFFNRPIRSDFINNFQLVAFGDVGTAWAGASPWSDDNPLYTRYIYRKPLFIKVEMQKDPIVEGFGFGARTRLFGYFLRGDLAWGVEDGVIQKPVFYFSLSLDF